MGPPSYMRSVVDRNVVMRRIPVDNSHKYSPPKILYAVRGPPTTLLILNWYRQCQRLCVTRQVPETAPLTSSTHFPGIFVFRKL